jgi:hypothetical protein
MSRRLSAFYSYHSGFTLGDSRVENEDIAQRQRSYCHRLEPHHARIPYDLAQPGSENGIWSSPVVL